MYQGQAMKGWFSGSKLPAMGWERDLASLRRRYKVMGNLIYFFAVLGIYQLVNEVVCLFWGEGMSIISGITFSAFFTIITYLALPLERQN